MLYILYIYTYDNRKVIKGITLPPWQPRAKVTFPLRKWRTDEKIQNHFILKKKIIIFRMKLAFAIPIVELILI